MAQTNYTPIYLYNSGTATNTPLAANLGAGELAINYTDGKLFYKDNNAAIQVIGWKTTPTTAGGTGLTSYTAGDLPYYASGSALSKLGIGTANYVLTSSGTAPQYVAQSTLSVGSSTNATNTAITDNTSSSATWYPTIVSATTGNLPQTTSSTKFTFVPSTGTLTTSYLTPSNALGVAYGGTALTTTPTNGQLLIGNGTNYTLATLTAGIGISVTNGSGSISVALKSPSFSAYLNSAQTITAGTFTKVQCATTQFDTNSNYNTSTYRFTPTVAGYYQVNATVNFGTASSQVICSLWRNGGRGNGSLEGQIAGAITGGTSCSASGIMQFNGSTDYLELYAYSGTVNNALNTGTNCCIFSATLISS